MSLNSGLFARYLNHGLRVGGKIQDPLGGCRLAPIEADDNEVISFLDVGNRDRMRISGSSTGGCEEDGLDRQGSCQPAAPGDSVDKSIEPGGESRGDGYEPALPPDRAEEPGVEAHSATLVRKRSLSLTAHVSFTFSRYAATVTHRVLIAEDDDAVRRSVARALRFEGYDVVTAENGERALVEAAKDPPDAIVLDIMMPLLDGLTVCRKIRATGDGTPILMLTAKHELADRVAGLDAGADDYLVKPFALEELLARVRALLRRRELPADSGLLRLVDLSLDPATRTVRRGERDVDLTKTEFDLLELLLMNSGIVLTRDTIYDRIWGFNFVTSSNSLDVYVGYLRRKTEAAGEPRLIHTVRGVGYVAREK